MGSSQIPGRGLLRSQSFATRFADLGTSVSPSEAIVASLLDGLDLKSPFEEKRSAFSLELGEKNLQEFLSLSQESDPAAFRQGLLVLGHRLAAQDKLDWALKIYGALQQMPASAGTESVSKQAEQRMQAILGQGSSGLRAEFLISKFAKDSTDLKMIVPMLAGTAVSSLVKTATLGRFAAMSGEAWYARGFGAKLAANLLAYGAEVPTFALTGRALRQIGAKPNAQDPSLGQELESSAITLGMLKLFSFAGNQAYGKLHGVNELGAATRFAGLAKFNQAAIGQASMFLGMLSSHKTEERLGLRPHVDGATTITDTLASMVSMGVGAHLGNKVLGEGYATWHQEMNVRTQVAEQALDRPRRVPSILRNPLFAPMWMAMGAGGLGGMDGGSSQGSGNTGRETAPKGHVAHFSFKKFTVHSGTGLHLEVVAKQDLGDLSRHEQWLRDAFLDILHMGEEEGEFRLQGEIAERLRKDRGLRLQLLGLGRSLELRFDAESKSILQLKVFHGAELELVLEDLTSQFSRMEKSADPVKTDTAHSTSKPKKSGELRAAAVPLVPAETGSAASVPEEPAGLPRSPGTQSAIVLRSYQREILDEFEANLRAQVHSWLGIASPMQTGKSFLIAPLLLRMEHVLGVKPRVWILSSARVITDQILEDLMDHSFPEPLGRFDGIKKDLQRVTVASIPALRKALSSMTPGAEPQVVIIDEAYFTQSPSVRKILAHFGLGEVLKQDRRTRIHPKSGSGYVIGLSGTGLGLEHYQPSGSLDLLTAIQEKWIRPMLGERVFTKGEVQEIQRAGEGMVWWRNTKENAALLAKLYRERIANAGYRKTLVYVPTIKHAESLQEAMQRQGETVHLVHSWRKEAENEKNLQGFEASGGALISVRKLSRGYRATGTEAVFHTYQTTSPEFFAQRTGRAWGNDPVENLPLLYILEAAWDQRDSFANLSRLLGFIDYPHNRLDTRELEGPLRRFKAQRRNREALDQAIELNNTSILFRNIPLLESWRILFADVTEREGGIAKTAEKTGLSRQSVQAFALGALPFSRDQVRRLEKLLGGSEQALLQWTEAWKSVVDEALEGSQRISDQLLKSLIQWRREKLPLDASANQLDGILLGLFAPPGDLSSKEVSGETEKTPPEMADVDKALKEEELSAFPMLDLQVREQMEFLSEEIGDKAPDEAASALFNRLQDLVEWDSLHALKSLVLDYRRPSPDLPWEEDEMIDLPDTAEIFDPNDPDVSEFNSRVLSAREEALALIKGASVLAKKLGLSNAIVLDTSEASSDSEYAFHDYLTLRELAKTKKQPLKFTLESFLNRMKNRVFRIYLDKCEKPIYRFDVPSNYEERKDAKKTAYFRNMSQWKEEMRSRGKK